MKQLFAISVLSAFSIMLGISILFPAGTNSENVISCNECGKLAKENTKGCFEKEGFTVKCNVLYHQAIVDCGLVCREP